jgi:hypothetical protein
MSSHEYNQLLKFLYFEGYADSYAEAEELLESMSDEEFDGVVEAFKEPDLNKMKRQEYRHQKQSTSQKGGSRGDSKNRASKMSSIRSALERGEDPRADGYGGARAARGNPPEDHRAAFSKNPMNNPPRKVKEPGVKKEEFESVVEYLFVEGFADTIEGAEEMAENISETWVNEILNEMEVQPPREQLKTDRDMFSISQKEKDAARERTLAKAKAMRAKKGIK